GTSYYMLTNLGQRDEPFVDCPLIYRLLDLQPAVARHIEGFVVLQVPVTAGQPVLTLDVVGKYSARPFNGEVSSFDVVVYDAKRIDNKISPPIKPCDRVRSERHFRPSAHGLSHLN